MKPYRALISIPIQADSDNVVDVDQPLDLESELVEGLRDVLHQRRRPSCP